MYWKGHLQNNNNSNYNNTDNNNNITIVVTTFTLKKVLKTLSQKQRSWQGSFTFCAIATHTKELNTKKIHRKDNLVQFSSEKIPTEYISKLEQKW